MRVLLVSDVHLGSHISAAARLLAFLKEREGTYDVLILLGDMFSDLNFGRLSKAHFELLNYLRKLSNPKRGVLVIWIEGNHDAGLIDVMAHLVGIEAHEVYRWTWNGKTCIAIHGHQFDGIIAKNGILTKIISFLYLEAQKITWFRRYLSMWIDKRATQWQRLTPVVAERAIAYARAHGADYIFCGHTHEVYHLAEDGIEYFNTGCWLGENCTYVLMTDDEIQVKRLPIPSKSITAP